MTRKRGISLIEVFVILGIVGLLMAILLPSLNRARELSREAAAAELGEILAVAPPPEPPTVEDMEEAAEDAADEHDIYDRVVALTENARRHRLEVRVDSLVLLEYNGELESVKVSIDGRKVYDQVDGEIRTYLGIGEWEHLLGDVERKVAADREDMFRSAREKRFGPLPGWGDKG